MHLPGGNSPFAREVKFHELLHVAYSPPEGVPDGLAVSKASILAAEDCRVNLKGATIRAHDAIGTSPEQPDPFTLVSKYSERRMAQLTAAMLGYASSDRLLDKLRDDIVQLEDTPTLPEWLRGHAADLCRAIYSVRRNAPDFINLEDMDFQNAVHLAKWLDTFSDDDGETKGKAQGSKDEESDYDEAPGHGGNADEARWGRMKIENPALSVRHKAAIGKRTTPCTEGAKLVHFNRLATGEVYGRTRKRAVPDAVLIDQSGSMHWNAKKLAELVKSMPVGVIAGYCGEDGTGVLRILAKDGRMVAPRDVKAPHGGNEVDGPALRWLAKQRGRKVWVSDEGVCSDRCSDEEALAADCARIVKGAGIKVCLSTKPRDIMAALRGLR
jgi:hypothetical protein